MSSCLSKSDEDMGGKCLNMEEAYSICRVNHPTGECCDFLDLSAYSQADPDALTLFATQGHRSGVRLGLTSLSIENAAVIANWGGIVEFTSLASLTREMASVLSTIQSPLSIVGLHELDECVAAELAGVQNSLSISLLGSLSMEAAKALAKHQCSLLIHFSATPSMAMQRSLLYLYQGHRLSLHFPIEEGSLERYMYINWYKEVTVSSTNDNLGITWMHVDSTAKSEDDLEDSRPFSESDVGMLD
ncbi:MAG: hypothetical protein HOO97_11800 [Sideroxydans sp.]|nr:hypothetical protein [Sideroxydans sp.]